jgi:TrmH family RNA methyltransferase
MARTGNAMITSAQNPLIKRIRSLRERKYRDLEGVFWVEGIRAVTEAVSSGATLERLIHAPGRLRSDRGRETVHEIEGRGIEVTEVSDRVFDTLSDREEGQGLGVLVRIRRQDLTGIPSTPRCLVLVLVEPHDPGNLGSIVRTADAAGVSGVVVVGPSADLYDPKSLRACMGSLFAVPVVGLKDFESFSWWAGPRGLRCVATSARASRSCFEADLSGSLALVLGPERGGLEEDVLRRCDAAVRVPMRGRASSLNLAAAAAVLIYEAVRQGGT